MISSNSNVPPMDLNLDLVRLSKADARKLRKVYSRYYNRILVLDVIGTYKDRKGKYGHLGHNAAQFVVERLVKTRLIQKVSLQPK